MFQYSSFFKENVNNIFIFHRIYIFIIFLSQFSDSFLQLNSWVFFHCIYWCSGDTG